MAESNDKPPEPPQDPEPRPARDGASANFAGIIFVPIPPPLVAKFAGSGYRVVRRGKRA
jgi:hypothetical protein